LREWVEIYTTNPDASAEQTAGVSRGIDQSKIIVSTPQTANVGKSLMQEFSAFIQHIALRLA